MSQDSERPYTDSPSLLAYLREEIPIEDIRDAHSAERIQSIDFVKGIAMIFIILCHVSAAWLDLDWVYIYGMVYAVLDILGPSLFVFLSALSVIFSIKRKQGKIPEKVLKARIYTRGIVIMAIGFLYNFIGFSTLIESDYSFPFTLWGWNILMFIGFSQIVSYHAIKIDKTWRGFVGVFIIFVSPGIRDMIYLAKDTNLGAWIAHFIITSPAPQVTLLPWLAVCFISTIFGEMLYEAMVEGPGLAYERLVRLFTIWGILFIIVGVFMPLPQPRWEWGLALQTFETLPVSEYPQLDLWRVMNQQIWYQFPGMPLFLIRGTSSAMIYQLGAALLLIAVSFNQIDIKRKAGRFIGMVIYYGKVSLSLFLLHYAFVPLFFTAYNIAFFPFVIITYIGFYGFIMYLWFEYFDGKGSPEWIMIQLGRVGQKTGEKIKEEGKKIVDKTVETFKKIGKPEQEIRDT